MDGRGHLAKDRRENMSLSTRLVAFGNPLLDIIVSDGDDSKIIEKYKLEKNVAQEVDTINIGFFDEVMRR